MQKIDKVVAKETRFIAAWVAIFSLVLQAVFLVIGKWDYTVLLGNILGGGAAVMNFLLMGLTIQKAVSKTEEKDAKQLMKLSNLLRNLFLFLIALVGVLLPVTNTWSTLIPLFFPRVAVMIRPLWDKKDEKMKESDVEKVSNENDTEEKEGEDDAENAERTTDADGSADTDVE